MTAEEKAKELTVREYNKSVKRRVKNNLTIQNSGPDRITVFKL